MNRPKWETSWEQAFAFSKDDVTGNEGHFAHLIMRTRFFQSQKDFHRF